MPRRVQGCRVEFKNWYHDMDASRGAETIAASVLHSCEAVVRVHAGNTEGVEFPTNGSFSPITLYAATLWNLHAVVQQHDACHVFSPVVWHPFWL